MEIELKEIAIRDLTDGYTDNAEEGIVAYGGKLDVRPPYQREFIYKDKQRDAVIDTVEQNFPLNVMYWAKREDSSFEVIDGQQRSLSICQYVNGDFAHNMMYFNNLRDDQKEKILNYKLMVYICTGSESEKLQWFKTINIAGEKLTDQELRNAVYCGPWVSDAKRYFSKTGCAAYKIGGDYLNCSPIRQEYLETAIKWKCGCKDDIEVYMANHQHYSTATDLWEYFQSVINWVKNKFSTYRKEMKGIEWGFLYNKFKDTPNLDPAALEKHVSELMLDEDVTNKKGIYEYVLTGNEKFLSIRTFDNRTKREVYEAQGGKCANQNCLYKDRIFNFDEMEADHITPWCQGGKTIKENCQMLCRACNRAKGGR